ncbi:hypothetical protein GALLN_00649 [Gallionellaceae bacterium]|nr:hypothetical protein GALLN_00649 [Gallionellaceae bacterium]
MLSQQTKYFFQIYFLWAPKFSIWKQTVNLSREPGLIIWSEILLAKKNLPTRIRENYATNHYM